MTPLLLALSAIGLLLFAAVLSWGSGRHAARFVPVFFALFGVCALAAMAGGVLALVQGTRITATLPLGLPWLPWHVALDALSGFFLLVIGLIGIAIAVYGPGYVREFEHSQDSLAVLGGFTALFLASMMLVVVAADAFLFMVAWEAMSVSSYFLVAFQHEHAANRRAALLYLLMAQIAGLSILLSFGVLAAFGHGFSFDAMRAAPLTPGWATAAFALALLGFGMKAGLVPLHVWLPEAHPAAPSHVSALMSGVMLKIAVYGFIRVVFGLLGHVQWQWGVVTLALGGTSALLGVLYALMQHDLKRLLAYHSVENIGIIFIGLGLSLIFLGTHHPILGALAFVAALYHTLNHAVFKSLLFLGAGAVVRASHEQDIEHMGGLLRRMPWTGLCFLIGCISIAALPPFNGFVSEWLTFQAALQAWSLHSGVLRSLVPIAAAVLALTGALAAACFVKAYGVAFLGQARSRQVRHAREVSFGMRCAQGGLALLCLLLGVLPTWVIDLINVIPRQLLGRGLTQVNAHGWLWLTPVDAGSASYSAPLVVLALGLGWWIMALWLRRGPVRQVRRTDAWDCGFAPPAPHMQYSATAFAQPIRRVFGPLFQINESVVNEDGRQRYVLQVNDRAWKWIYLPIAASVQHIARAVTWLQRGHVRIYLTWTLLSLLVLLWVVS